MSRSDKQKSWGNIKEIQTNGNPEWTGGINFEKNLVVSISLLEKRESNGPISNETFERKHINNYHSCHHNLAIAYSKISFFFALNKPSCHIQSQYWELEETFANKIQKIPFYFSPWEIFLKMFFSRIAEFCNLPPPPNLCSTCIQLFRLISFTQQLNLEL